MPGRFFPDGELEHIQQGSKVVVNWRNGNWYSGTVTQINSADPTFVTFDVDYDDGDSERNVEGNRVKNMPIIESDLQSSVGVGSSVLAIWDENGCWYPAEISRVNGDGSFDILFEDGEKSDRVNRFSFALRLSNGWFEGTTVEGKRYYYWKSNEHHLDVDAKISDLCGNNSPDTSAPVVKRTISTKIENRSGKDRKTSITDESLLASKQRSKTLAGDRYKEWASQTLGDEKKYPTVFCTIKIYRILGIDLKTLQFEVDFVLMMDWIDGSVIGAGDETDLDLENDHFSPYVQIHNAVEENVKPVDYAKNRLQDAPNHPGHVKRTERYRTKLSMPDVTLKKYPFDKHVLKIQLKGDHVVIRSDSTKKADEVNPRKEQHTIKGVDLSNVAGWGMLGMGDKEIDSKSSGTVMEIGIEMERNPYGVVMLLIFPLIICIILSLTSFVLEAEDLAERLTITVTMLLAVAAFHQQAQSHVQPNLPYTTVLDDYMLSNVFLFLTQGLIHVLISLKVTNLSNVLGCDSNAAQGEAFDSLTLMGMLKLLNPLGLLFRSDENSKATIDDEQSEPTGYLLYLNLFLISCALLVVKEAWSGLENVEKTRASSANKDKDKSSSSNKDNGKSSSGNKDKGKSSSGGKGKGESSSGGKEKDESCPVQVEEKKDLRVILPLVFAEFKKKLTICIARLDAFRCKLVAHSKAAVWYCCRLSLIALSLVVFMAWAAKGLRFNALHHVLQDCMNAILAGIQCTRGFCSSADNEFICQPGVVQLIERALSDENLLGFMLYSIGLVHFVLWLAYVL